MDTPADTVDRDEAADPDDAPRNRSRRPKRLWLWLLVGVALLVGLLARSLVSDGTDSSLLSWLPWLNRTPITLYYAEESGDYLVPVSRSLSRGEATAPALVDEWLAGPADGTGLVNLVPAGTVARAVAIEGTTLNVDLSGDYEALSSPMTRQALHRSLASWPDAEDVNVTVDGVPLDLAVSSGHALYFYDEARDMLVVEPIDLNGPQAVLDAYLDGPGEDHLAGLPPDVRLLSYDLQPNGLLKLNFTYTSAVREFAVDHPDAMRRVLEGLIATMTTEFPEIEGVWIDFEGHANLGLGQCAHLLRTLQLHPEVLNDERLLSRYAGA